MASDFTLETLKWQQMLLMQGAPIAFNQRSGIIVPSVNPYMHPSSLDGLLKLASNLMLPQQVRHDRVCFFSAHAGLNLRMIKRSIPPSLPTLCFSQPQNCSRRQSLVIAEARRSPVVYKKRRKRLRVKVWSSPYHGVSWYKRDKRWIARLYIEGESQYLGSFNDKRHAALVVDQKSIRIYGEENGGVPLNIPCKDERLRLAAAYDLPTPHL